MGRKVILQTENSCIMELFQILENYSKDAKKAHVNGNYMTNLPSIYEHIYKNVFPHFLIKTKNKNLPFLLTTLLKTEQTVINRLMDVSDEDVSSHLQYFHYCKIKKCLSISWPLNWDGTFNFRNKEFPTFLLYPLELAMIGELSVPLSLSIFSSLLKGKPELDNGKYYEIEPNLDFDTFQACTQLNSHSEQIQNLLGKGKSSDDLGVIISKMDTPHYKISDELTRKNFEIYASSFFTSMKDYTSLFCFVLLFKDVGYLGLLFGVFLSFLNTGIFWFRFLVNFRLRRLSHQQCMSNFSKIQPHLMERGGSFKIVKTKDHICLQAGGEIRFDSSVFVYHAPVNGIFKSIFGVHNIDVTNVFGKQKLIITTVRERQLVLMNVLRNFFDLELTSMLSTRNFKPNLKHKVQSFYTWGCRELGLYSTLQTSKRFKASYQYHFLPVLLGTLKIIEQDNKVLVPILEVVDDYSVRENSYEEEETVTHYEPIKMRHDLQWYEEGLASESLDQFLESKIQNKKKLKYEKKRFQSDVDFYLKHGADFQNGIYPSREEEVTKKVVKTRLKKFKKGKTVKMRESLSEFNSTNLTLIEIDDDVNLYEERVILKRAEKIESLKQCLNEYKQYNNKIKKMKYKLTRKKRKKVLNPSRGSPENVKGIEECRKHKEELLTKMKSVLTNDASKEGYSRQWDEYMSWRDVWMAHRLKLDLQLSRRVIKKPPLYQNICKKMIPFKVLYRLRKKGARYLGELTRAIKL